MNSKMLSDHFDAYEPKRILAVGAHADDIDFGASGSIAVWAEQGAEIDYLVITNGCKGSHDPNMTCADLRKLREQEQRDAIKVLGAKNVHFLGYEDGELENTLDLRRDIAEVIRTVKPDTVIVMDPTMVYLAELGFINHPDHRAAGQATLDAVYPLARDRLSFPEHAKKGLEPHKVAHVLLINLEKQNCYIDISDMLERKLTALFKHDSQIPDEAAATSMLTDRAAKLGAECGVQYAESFIRIDCPQ